MSLNEAHVQHAVSLVEHQHLDLRELHVTTLTEIEQTTWGGDDDVEPTAECIDLRLEAHAAEDHKRAHVHMLSVIDDALVHLCGELTSRRQHQCTRALVLAIKLRFGQGSAASAD